MVLEGVDKEPMPRRRICERMKHNPIPAPAFPASNPDTTPPTNPKISTVKL